MAKAPPALPTSRPDDGPDVPVADILAPYFFDGVEPVGELDHVSALRRGWQVLASGVHWIFGAATLVVGLAVVGTLPVLQFLSLGYLLEASGRIARSGRLRAGFIGIRQAAVIGGVVLGIWLVRLPLRFAASLWEDARLIEAHGQSDRTLGGVVVVLTLLLGLHVVGAFLRGGRLRDFLLPPRPLRLLKMLFRRETYRQARDRVYEFVVKLRLPYYFWLGLRGFLGGLVWLFIPVTLLAVAPQMDAPAAGLVGLLGGLLLIPVVLHLPLLQTRFAMQNRWRAMFELRAARKSFRRAPAAWALAITATLLLALPLYLLKIELVPREAAWLPSLLFVSFMLPARLLAGWALARAEKNDVTRGFWRGMNRWGSRLALVPIAAAYALPVYFTQYLSWYGAGSLYEQHAFLVPVPFWGL